MKKVLLIILLALAGNISYGQYTDTTTMRIIEQNKSAKEGNLYLDTNAKIFKIGFLNKGLTELTYLKDFLRAHLKNDSFESLKLPLHVCISNINSGRFEIISEGKLIEVLSASCALPLLFNILALGYENGLGSFTKS